MVSSKKPFFGLTGGWLTFWLTVACGVDMTLFGYDQGVFSGVVVTQDFLELHDLVGPTKTKTLSTVTAIYDVGCCLGAILAFTIGDSQGRKKCILLGTAIIAIGTILQASSYSLAQMFVGRVVLGIGNGMNTATAPIWQTETAQAIWRGKLVIFELGLNVGGYCIVNWINYGLSFHEGPIAWRLPIALQFVLIITLFLIVPLLPESPRWLISRDRHDEASEVLACIEGMSINDPYITTQHNEIKFSIQYERDNAVRWRDLLLRRQSDGTKTLRRLLLGAGTQAIQQLQGVFLFRTMSAVCTGISANQLWGAKGINIMSYYLPTVLMNSVGLSNSLARLLTACNATSYFIFSCLAVTVVERLGRRGLMMLSGFGQFVCFLVITILLRFAEIDKAYATASVVFFFLYHIAFGMGMLGVPWLYPTEINSLPMRTKGAAVATATNWITNFAIVEITPIGIQNIGWKFWIVWTVLNAVFLPIIYFLYPETANRTLEDVDAYYRSNPPLIVAGDPDATSTKRPLRFIQHEDNEVQRRAKQTESLASKGDEFASAEHVG